MPATKNYVRNPATRKKKAPPQENLVFPGKKKKKRKVPDSPPGLGVRLHAGVDEPRRLPAMDHSLTSGARRLGEVVPWTPKENRNQGLPEILSRHPAPPPKKKKRKTKPF